MVRPEPIRVAVERVLGDLRAGKRLGEAQILDVWPEIAGKRIAQHTRPVTIRNGRLLVNVDRSVWLYELSQRYKGRLLKRLQKRVGKDTLRDIQFRMGEV